MLDIMYIIKMKKIHNPFPTQPVRDKLGSKDVTE